MVGAGKLSVLFESQRAEALVEFLTEWEAEHGALTIEEITRAERKLGLSSADSTA